MRPLEGLKAIELGIWFAGPAAGMLLAECGADVIKIEPLGGGDPIRGLDLEERWGAETPPFNYMAEMVNRGKRSAAIDLRIPEGRELVYNLARTADIFVTNVRPQALDHLEMTPETISALNPRLVYGLLTGFGPNGPDKNKPAFDEVGFWARGGFLSFMGEPGGPPTHLHGAMGDLTSAVCMTNAISLALLVRERTGKGQIVDSSLLSSGMWVAGYDLHRTLFSGDDVLRETRTSAPSPLYNTYQCGDGRWVQFAMPQGDRYWRPTCLALEVPHLADDTRFNNHGKMMKSHLEAIKLLDEAFAQRPLAEWAPRFDEFQLVWAQDARLSEVVADPQVEANKYLVEVEHPGLGTYRELGLPFALRDTPTRPSGPAPEWGQHTEEVLRELDYSWEQIIELKDRSVIA